MSGPALSSAAVWVAPGHPPRSCCWLRHHWTVWRPAGPARCPQSGAAGALPGCSWCSGHCRRQRLQHCRQRHAACWGTCACYCMRQRPPSTTENADGQAFAGQHAIPSASLHSSLLHPSSLSLAPHCSPSHPIVPTHPLVPTPAPCPHSNPLSPLAQCHALGGRRRLSAPCGVHRSTPRPAAAGSAPSSRRVGHRHQAVRVAWLEALQ
jgi:hypothetical protein